MLYNIYLNQARKAGPGVNKKPKYQVTPLHICAMNSHFQLHQQPTVLGLRSPVLTLAFHQMETDGRNFRLREREKWVLSSLILTFSKVDHAILSSLWSLVFYRETDFLPNQLLPKELSSRKCPGLRDKTNVSHENCLVSHNQHSSSFLQYPTPALGPEESIKMKCTQHKSHT